MASQRWMGFVIAGALGAGGCADDTGAVTEEGSSGPSTSSTAGSSESSTAGSESSTQGSSDTGSSSTAGESSGESTQGSSSSESSGSESSSSAGESSSSAGESESSTAAESSSDDGAPACACDGDEYCDYPYDACGDAAAGVCTARPVACRDVDDPVCGCDGETYFNDCEAAAAGVDVDYAGECAVIEACDCGPGQYCELPVGECEGEDGVCVELPEACGEIYSPVCGCDGVDYVNPCEAAAAGINVAYEGMC